MNRPFAVEVFERFMKGESIRQLADELQIPAERVEARLRAAAQYLETHPGSNPVELPAGHRVHYGHGQ